jgi:hypothetical protein
MTPLKFRYFYDPNEDGSLCYFIGSHSQAFSFLGEYVSIGNEILTHVKNIDIFTGILDINGKEIYTNDILSYGCYTQRYEGLVALSDKGGFVYKCFSFKTEDGYEIWPKTGMMAFDEGWFHSEMKFPYAHVFKGQLLKENQGDEIIGNVYQNPEIF